MSKPLAPTTEEEFNAQIDKDNAMLEMDRKSSVTYARNLIFAGEDRDHVWNALMTRTRSPHMASYYLYLAEHSL